MADSIATQQKLQFDFFLDDSWEGSFDRVEVWRSRLSGAGPYEAITDATWTPARLPVGAGARPSVPETGPFLVISGRSLLLRVNEAIDLTISFTGSDPLTLAQCATQVADQSGGLLSSYVLGGRLVIETQQPGGAAVLRCVGGDAAPALKLATAEPASVAFGKDANLALVQGELSYTITDYNGSSHFWYKTRFRNSLTGALSDFSTPFQVGKGGVGLSSDRLIVGYVELVDAQGQGLKNREVLVYNRFDGSVFDEKVVAGGTVKMLTDKNGRAEFTLVRGSYVTVGVSGTSLVRDIHVPTDPTLDSFNLMSAEVGSNDVFTVRVPVLSYGVRRSM